MNRCVISASSNPTRLANPRIFGNELFEDDLDNIADDPRNPTDEEVAEVVREKVKEQVNTAFEVLRARIDKFGVASPTIQKNQRNTAQIIVELPGIKDEKRVVKTAPQQCHYPMGTDQTHSLQILPLKLQEIQTRKGG